MNHRLLATVIAVASLSTPDAAHAAENQTGFYLSCKPGVAVDYLALNDTGREVTGYLEQIQVSVTSPDGQIRTQTFVKRRGAILTFGSMVVTRVKRGYEMTATSQAGLIEETLFLPVSATSVNASIVALSASASRKRSEIDRQSAAATLRTYGRMSADDSRRLARAQLAVQSAAAELRRAQSAADRLSAFAREMRLQANAKVDQSGVSFEQNQNRLSAMNAADVAEQNVVAAQHTADVAGLALSASLADVTKLQTHLADVSRRAQALATRASNDPATAAGR